MAPAIPGSACAGRMRIAVSVAVSVMLAMDRDPPGDLALHGHCAKDFDGCGERCTRDKGAMAEQAVIAERDTEAGDEGYGQQQQRLKPGDTVDGEPPYAGDAARRHQEETEDRQDLQQLDAQNAATGAAANDNRRRPPALGGRVGFRCVHHLSIRTKPARCHAAFRRLVPLVVLSTTCRRISALLK